MQPQLIRRLPGVAATLCAAAAASAAASDPGRDMRPVWNPVVPEQIAVLPVHNLSLRPAPVDLIRERCAALLAERGIPVADPVKVERILAELRLRYVGGISAVAGRALLQQELDGVLVLTLDQYQEEDPPRVGLQARLVSLKGGEPRVLHAVSVAVAGDEDVGAFERRRVRDPAVLVERAVSRIAEGVAAYNDEPVATRERRVRDARDKFAPRSFYAAPALPELGVAPLRIAVLPFKEETPRRGAGEIVGLHLANELRRVHGVEIVEPGQVRQVLLDTRTVQEGGLSLAQGEVVRAILEVDMVVIGTVSEYREEGDGGPPYLAFSAQGIDAARRQVDWVARSEASGLKGVFWFNAGAVPTIHGLAEESARSMVAELVRQAERQARARVRTGGSPQP